MKRAALAGAVLVAGIALAGAPKGTSKKAKGPARQPAAAATQKGDGGTRLEFGTIEFKVKGTVTVYLDGKELGQTPLKPVKVMAGKHQLRLVSQELGAEHQEELEVRPRMTSTLEIAFQEE